MKTVNVIGIGETKFGKLKDYSIRDLIREAGNAAIRDAGVEKAEIQAVYVGNYNASMLCGQSFIGPMVSETLELGPIPTLRTEGACASGGLAFRQAWTAVASGIYDIVLVGGVEKMTHRSSDQVTEAIATAEDAELEAAAGMTFPSIFAMIANRYFYEYGNVREEMALCAVNNHANACLNPDAQLHKPICVQDVLDAAPVADPLTVYDCSLVSDGAAFLVLASSEAAEHIKNGKRPVQVAGSGHGGDTLSLSGRSCITTFNATKRAASEAYQMAGITPADVDLVELHDCFTITQILTIEDLGFFEKGKGGAAVADGLIARDGKIPVNVSGGLKAKGHAIGATGISQMYEIVTQLRGDAGERQVAKADIGLAQNLGGAGGVCMVHVFRGA